MTDPIPIPFMHLGSVVRVILSIAHASVEDPDAEFIMGAWSDIVVGDRPTGLLNCYLSRDKNELYMVSVWRSEADHDRALADEASHPSFGFFEACGVDPQHSNLTVIGHLA